MSLITDVRGSLAQTPRIVEGLVAAAPREALYWREADDTWNSVEVLCHLADGEITDWMPRIEKILSGGGRFTPFNREGGLARYRGWTAEALVGEFGQLRRANLEKLDNLNLTAPHLALTGQHPEFGTVTLSQLLACSFGRHVGPWRKYFSLLQGDAA